MIKVTSLKKATRTWFIWTPGHCGIDGNEKADRVARETINDPMMEICFYSSLIDIHKNVSTCCTDL